MSEDGGLLLPAAGGAYLAADPVTERPSALAGRRVECRINDSVYSSIEGLGIRLMDDQLICIEEGFS